MDFQNLTSLNNRFRVILSIAFIVLSAVKCKKFKNALSEIECDEIFNSRDVIKRKADYISSIKLTKVGEKLNALEEILVNASAEKIKEAKKLFEVWNRILWIGNCHENLQLIIDKENITLEQFVKEQKPKTLVKFDDLNKGNIEKRIARLISKISDELHNNFLGENLIIAYGKILPEYEAIEPVDEKDEEVNENYYRKPVPLLKGKFFSCSLFDDPDKRDIHKEKLKNTRDIFKISIRGI